MNPLTGGLKFLSTTLFNSLLALVFFFVAGHFASPSFVGKVAIIQLVETVITSFFSVLPFPLITREVAHLYASSQDYTKMVYTSLTYSLLVSPFLLFLLFFPSYLWISIPYFLLFLITTYQSQLLTGLGKFTEVNIGNAIFTQVRWGVSIIAVFYHSIKLLILIWTLGLLVRVIYYQRFLPFRLYIDRQIFKDIVKTGFAIYISSIIGFASYQGDRVVTALLLGTYDLGIYQLVALAATVPPMLISSLFSSLLPSSTYYYAKGKDIVQMSSLSFRVAVLLSLPIAILGYAVSPLFISKLFPEYVSGIPAMQLLVLTFTAMMPLQTLSTFMIAAKRSYTPFIIIGSASGIETVGVSLYLIPRMGILGAAIAQAVNTVLVSALILFFSYLQDVFRLGRREAIALVTVCMSFLTLVNWVAALVTVLVSFKVFGLISSEEVKIVEAFTTPVLRNVTRILYLVSR